MRKLERVSFPCAYCGAPSQKKITSKKQFCSQRCAALAPKPQTATGSNVPCAGCGASFYLPAYRILRSKRHFCGPACHNDFQRRSKVRRACQVCNTEFLLSPSNAAMTAGRYCSIECRTSCSTWRENAAIAGNLEQMRKRGPNRLELAGRAILDGLGLAHEEQVLIGGKFTVDVRLVDRPVVIQWDGDYWHGYRAPGDIRPLDARQAKRATFDRTQDAYMRAAGLVVLRFWEHEVMKSPSAVAAAISVALGAAD